MIRLLQLLIFGHFHKWETCKEVRIDWDNGAESFMYICRCEKCGAIKKFDCKP